jgi:hypothetical protein
MTWPSPKPEPLCLLHHAKPIERFDFVLQLPAHLNIHQALLSG